MARGPAGGGGGGESGRRADRPTDRPARGGGAPISSAAAPAARGGEAALLCRGAPPSPARPERAPRGGRARRVSAPLVPGGVLVGAGC